MKKLIWPSGHTGAIKQLQLTNLLTSTSTFEIKLLQSFAKTTNLLADCADTTQSESF